MYRGKQPCAGCGASGKLQNRPAQNVVCFRCAEIMRLGRAYRHEQANDYTMASMQWYSIPFANLDDDVYGRHRLQDAIKVFLRAIENPDADVSGHFAITPVSATTASDRFRIRLPHAEAIKSLVDLLIDQQNGIKKLLKGIEPRIESEIRKRKTAIFNAGIAKGKELLIGLNDGTLSIHDFDKPIEYNGKK